MVGFVIPFKPSSRTQDWAQDNRLLKRTLESLLNQKSPHFKVFIICTDFPRFKIYDSRVNLAQAPFSFVPYTEIPGNSKLVEKFPNEKWLEGLWDKSRKVCYGCFLAKKEGCDYIMALDSDDLVSKKLVAYVEENKFDGAVPGWFINKGYIYRDKSFYLIKNYKINYINASTHIIRSDLIKIPDFYSTNWVDYNLFTDHGYLKDRMKHEYNEDLKPLPFFAIVYLAHSNNMSNIEKSLSKINLKSLIKKIVYGVKMNGKIAEEFSIHSI